jgi:hypothetical protein
MEGTITLTTAGTDTGPFNLYSNADGYISAFEVNVSKADLEAGYFSILIPEGTTSVRIMSMSKACRNYIDVVGTVPPTTTTSTTTLAPGTIIINNLTSGSNIESIFDLVTDLVYPVLPETTEIGLHEGALLNFLVEVSGPTPCCICVYVNGVLISCLTTAPEASFYLFGTGGVDPADIIEIYFTNGACV